MAKTNSTQVRTSRYVSGGETEVGQNALEWWERAVFTAAADDTLYVVELKLEGRLDLITALFLGEPRYWWVVAQYNNLLDPFAEVKEGKVLHIPSAARVDAIMSGRTGGVPSTREVPTSIFPIV